MAQAINGANTAISRKDRKSTRLNSSHQITSYAVFCLKKKIPAPSGTDTLRVHAVSRLMLDNIPHIKAFWISTGLEVAQTSLWFGVDDLDGFFFEEKGYHLALHSFPTRRSSD